MINRVHLRVSLDRVEELGFSMKALGKMRTIMQDADIFGKRFKESKNRGLSPIIRSGLRKMKLLQRLVQLAQHRLQLLGMVQTTVTDPPIAI